MQVTIKFKDNGKQVVLHGDFDEVTMDRRKAPGMAVRTLWFDVEDEYGCNYEVSIYNTSDEWDDDGSTEWQVSHVFHWHPVDPCYTYELNNGGTDFEIRIK